MIIITYKTALFAEKKLKQGFNYKYEDLIKDFNKGKRVTYQDEPLKAYSIIEE